MAAAKNKNNKTTILFRYGIITFGFLLFAAIVVSRLFTTTIIEAPEWNERAKKDFARIDTLKPERGDILANTAIYSPATSRYMT